MYSMTNTVSGVNNHEFPSYFLYSQFFNTSLYEKLTIGILYTRVLL